MVKAPVKARNARDITNARQGLELIQLGRIGRGKNRREENGKGARGRDTRGFELVSQRGLVREDSVAKRTELQPVTPGAGRRGGILEDKRVPRKVASPESITDE